MARGGVVADDGASADLDAPACFVTGAMRGADGSAEQPTSASKTVARIVVRHDRDVIELARPD
jgi:hypothetical protein